jgi:hypothetical protein
MIPVGYMAKSSCKKPKGFDLPNIDDVYSVGSCVNDDFADYTNYWKHNGYWLFDSPAIIQTIAQENAVNIQGSKLFYYEAHETEFTGDVWRPFSPDPSIPTNVIQPSEKKLEGFDVVTFYCGNAPECSPLSCCYLAQKIQTNSHCLFETFDEADTSLNSGNFTGGEPGPYRIFAVYSVDWP